MNALLKSPVAVTILGLGLGFGLAGNGAASAAPAAAPTIADLAWLAGDWQSADGEGPRTTTHYGEPDGGVLLGQMTMVDAASGALLFYEFETFSVQDGVVTLAPLPFGNPGVAFKAVVVEAGRLRLENPGNDFPRVIEYRLLPDGRLWSLAEGVENGAPQRLEYTQVRLESAGNR